MFVLCFTFLWVHSRLVDSRSQQSILKNRGEAVFFIKKLSLVRCTGPSATVLILRRGKQDYEFKDSWATHESLSLNQTPAFSCRGKRNVYVPRYLEHSHLCPGKLMHRLTQLSHLLCLLPEPCHQQLTDLHETRHLACLLLIRAHPPQLPEPLPPVRCSEVT